MEIKPQVEVGGTIIRLYVEQKKGWRGNLQL